MHRTTHLQYYCGSFSFVATLGDCFDAGCVTPAVATTFRTHFTPSTAGHTSFALARPKKWTEELRRAYPSFLTLADRIMYICHRVTPAQRMSYSCAAAPRRILGNVVSSPPLYAHVRRRSPIIIIRIFSIPCRPSVVSRRRRWKRGAPKKRNST